MKLSLNTNVTQKIFTAYGEGYVTVSGERFERPIVVLPEKVLTDWHPPTVDAMDETHFDYFLAIKPAILLLGTGTQQRFLHPRLYKALSAAGISVEFMDTGAACRTYNILMAEDRNVVAAILV